MFMSDSCNRYRCSHCKSINRGSECSSSNTGINYKLRIDTNCTTQYVIYLVTCKRCDKQYTGQTTQPVAKLINTHRFDISNFMFSSLVATHFNSEAHCINDFSFMPIAIVRNNINRLCLETFWYLSPREGERTTKLTVHR